MPDVTHTERMDALAPMSALDFTYTERTAPKAARSRPDVTDTERSLAEEAPRRFEPSESFTIGERVTNSAALRPESFTGGDTGMRRPPSDRDTFTTTDIAATATRFVDTGEMAKQDALRRLGGGRWETRDGRFQIEPQSGTWVIVDTTQTNEFGLPLVRGPYPSLGDARDAIDTARTEGPVTSPLADRIDEVRRQAPPTTRDAKSARAVAPKTAARDGPKPAAEPPPPPDPAWFRDLTFADRRRAKELITRLEALDVGDAEAVARAEIAGDEPALARLALELRLREAARAANDPQAAVTAAIEAILVGEDEALGAEWRLVDGRGRRIERLDPGG